MATPENPAGSAENPDAFSDGKALAAPSPTAAARYVEDPRELVGGHAVRLLRNGLETFPVWLEAI